MRDIGFDARLTVAWAFTLLALAVLAGGILPSTAAGALVVVPRVVGVHCLGAGPHLSVEAPRLCATLAYI